MKVNKIYQGDALSVLQTFPDNSIDMCMTSPPYWGLRDYGVEQVFGGNKDCKHEWGPDLIQKQRGAAAGVTAQVGNQKKKTQGTHVNQGSLCSKCNAWKGQLGLEPTPELYIQHMTEIFIEVKRVLKKEGTLWVVIGDTYFNDNRGGIRPPGNLGNDGRYDNLIQVKCENLPSKCLCMIPERLAWAMIQDGWVLRNKNIWYKHNAMPSSVRDRFSNKWEYVYMFSQNNKAIYWTNKKTKKLVNSQPPGINGTEGKDWKWKEVNKETKKISLWTGHDYYFDLNAVRESFAESTLNDFRIECKTGRPNKKAHELIKKGTHGKGGIGDPSKTRADLHNPLGKNPGDVFEINTQPYPEAHFAVYPVRLCEKPIKAGCPKEICIKCGKARERVVEKYDTGKTQKVPDYWDVDAGRHKAIHRKGRSKGKSDIPVMENKTIGWTSCDCNIGFKPGIVIDPFSGAGTTCYAAAKLGRDFIGIEIGEKYKAMSEERIFGSLFKSMRENK